MWQNHFMPVLTLEWSRDSELKCNLQMQEMLNERPGALNKLHGSLASRFSDLTSLGAKYCTKVSSYKSTWHLGFRHIKEQ